MWTRARAAAVATGMPAPEAVLAATFAARARALAVRVLLHLALLAAAAVAFAAYEHFKLEGASTESTASLVAAAVLGLSPVRALVHELLAIEGKLLHLVHGLAGLGVVGLTAGGVVSGRPVLDHAALAPFAIMAAAQGLMHAPRSPEQAAAVRRFTSSLPEVQRLSRSGAFSSPASAGESIAALTDLIAKAQALGETELRGDPAFQSALRRATVRTGLSLGLDSADAAIASLASNPAAASAVPELRRQLARARRVLDAPAAANGAGVLLHGPPRLRDADAGGERRGAGAGVRP